MKRHTPSPLGHKESDTTERLTQHTRHIYVLWLDWTSQSEMYSFGPHYFGPSRTAVTEMHFLHHDLVVKRNGDGVQPVLSLAKSHPTDPPTVPGSPWGAWVYPGTEQHDPQQYFHVLLYFLSFSSVSMFVSQCTWYISSSVRLCKYKQKYLYWGVQWYFTYGRLIKFGKQCLLEEFCRDQGYKKLHFFQGFGLPFSINTISPVTKCLSFLALVARNLRARFRTQSYLQNACGWYSEGCGSEHD